MSKGDLLSLLQSHIPIEERPFLRIAEELGTSEDKVLREIKRLKEERLVRQISPIYDTKAVGYDSALVAFRVERGRIEEVAKFINSHPGVSHNYERKDSFNLWFTIAVPPDGKLTLEETVALIAERTGVGEYAVLRGVRTFKIGVRLDFKKLDEKENVKSRKEKRERPLTELEKKVIRLTQKDIPLVSRPFSELAQKLGIEERRLIDTLRSFKERNIMRRFSAILHHRRIGFIANGMAVWRVPKERVEEVGRYLASFKSVSHCYERTTNNVWKYNLFSLVHGKSEEEVLSFIDKLGDEIGIKDYKVLFSSKEFKKKRVELFSEAFYEWERENLGIRADERENSPCVPEAIL